MENNYFNNVYEALEQETKKAYNESVKLFKDFISVRDTLGLDDPETIESMKAYKNAAHIFDTLNNLEGVIHDYIFNEECLYNTVEMLKEY